MVKPRPNHRRYQEALAGLTPEARLKKAFELSEFARSLFRHGLRRRFPDASEAELNEIMLRRLEKCHNQNY